MTKSSVFIGFYTLLYKEVLRFWKVSFQTVAAPVVTALLYLAVFAQSLRAHVQIYPGIDYLAFLAPGLAMMSALQNAFANSSSSIIQSKVTGNMVFMLLAPLGAIEIFLAYTLAAVVRGLSVCAGVYLAIWAFVPISMASLGTALAFAAVSSAAMGILGIIAGIWTEKFDQLAAFQNFIVMPLTFLSGVFYTTHSLPPFLRKASEFNPFFYMLDGFRHSMLGISDIPVARSWAVVLGFLLFLSAITLAILRSGYKLRG